MNIITRSFISSALSFAPSRANTSTYHHGWRQFSSENSKNNHFPLHEAVQKGCIKSIKQILRAKIADVNGFDHKGETSMVIAAKKYKRNDECSEKILQLLHRYGACYLCQNKDGEAALTYIKREGIDGSKYFEKFNIDILEPRNSGRKYPTKSCINQYRQSSSYDKLKNRCDITFTVKELWLQIKKGVNSRKELSKLDVSLLKHSAEEIISLNLWILEGIKNPTSTSPLTGLAKNWLFQDRFQDVTCWWRGAIDNLKTKDIKTTLRQNIALKNVDILLENVWKISLDGPYESPLSGYIT